MHGYESQSKQQCFSTNATALLLNGGKHRRAIYGLQERVERASLTIQVYLPYELPRQCFYYMRSIVSWSANYFLNLLTTVGEMHFSVLLPGKKKHYDIINQLKQVSLHQQQGQGIPSMQSLPPYNTKGFFLCVRAGAQRRKDLSVNYTMIVQFWSITMRVRDY